MASLLDIWIKAETLQTLSETINKKGEKGIAITLSVDDESNDYGQNVSAFVSQSKEDREAKKKKYYIGNGKVFWTDGNILKGYKPEKAAASEPVSYDNTKDDDLPF